MEFSNFNVQEYALLSLGVFMKNCLPLIDTLCHVLGSRGLVLVMLSLNQDFQPRLLLDVIDCNLAQQMNWVERGCSSVTSDLETEHGNHPRDRKSLLHCWMSKEGATDAESPNDPLENSTKSKSHKCKRSSGKYDQKKQEAVAYHSTTN